MLSLCLCLAQDVLLVADNTECFLRNCYDKDSGVVIVVYND